MPLTTNKFHTFGAGAKVLKRLGIPESAGAPAGAVAGDIWIDTNNGGALMWHNGTAPVQVGTSTISDELIQDIIGPFLVDTSDIDFTYDDTGNTASAQVKAGSITWSKLQNMSTARILGRVTAGGGSVEELTAAQVKTLLAIVTSDLSDFSEGVQDVIGALASGGAGLTMTYTDASNTWVLDVNADNATLEINADTLRLKDGGTTNAKLANMAQATFKGRAAGAGTGAPVDLTAAQAKTALAIVAADVSDFVANARTSISVSDTATLDLNYNSGTGVLSGAVLDSPTVGGLSAAALQTQIINAISGGAGAAYDTLIEIQNFLQADDTADAALVTAVGIRARFVDMAVPSGAPTADIAHNLALTNVGSFIAKVYVAATGVEEGYDVTPKTGALANTVVITDETGANIPAGRRILIVAGT